MGEKTEKATPKKRRDERKKGHVFLSKDAVSVASLFGSILMLRLYFASAARSIQRFMRYCFAFVSEGGFPQESVFLQAIVTLLRVTGPFLAVTIFLAVVVTFAQTRMLVTFEVLKPKFSKLNPLSGFKRLFSMRSLVEAVKGILKVSVLLYMIYSCLRDLLDISQRYMYADLMGSCSHLFYSIFSMLLRVAAAFLVLAALDFLYQWWAFERDMKMTKQEVKEEYKQMEGDPKIKGKIKELQRKMAMSRMMQQVPKSDVIIRNPTHVAVALRYRATEDEAPVVLAMGLDSLALRIVSMAQEHDIMVIENVPLARALYAEAELNQPIPSDLYEEVAEVMVYLYKLGRIEA